MRRFGRRLTPSDLEVWRAVAETVDRRLPGAVLPAQPETLRPRAVKATETASKATAPGWSPPASRIAASRTPGVIERTVRKRLARGRAEIEASLDLHGYRQSDAHTRLSIFIQKAHRDGLRLVLVVTGKGRGSDDRGVLRRLVPLWLSEARLAPFVIGFGEAGRGHGDEGALYVHLRSRRRLEAE